MGTARIVHRAAHRVRNGDLPPTLPTRIRVLASWRSDCTSVRHAVLSMLLPLPRSSRVVRRRLRRRSADRSGWWSRGWSRRRNRHGRRRRRWRGRWWWRRRRSAGRLRGDADRSAVRASRRSVRDRSGRRRLLLHAGADGSVLPAAAVRSSGPAVRAGRSVHDGSARRRVLLHAAAKRSVLPAAVQSRRSAVRAGSVRTGPVQR